MFSFFQLSAQSGGYPNLEFVENKGQWDPLVKFRAELTAGALFMQQKGFTVLMHDTNDLSRIRRLLHGDEVAAAGRGAGNTETGTSTKKVTEGPPGKRHGSHKRDKSP